MLQSDAKLPVELAMERAAARRRICTARASTCRACPRCGSRIACGGRPRSTSWSAAASPIAPATASRSIARARSIAAGEIAQLSYDAQMTTTQRACRACCGCAPSLRPRRTAARAAQGHPFRLRRCRRLRQPPDRLGRRRARRGHHQPAAATRAAFDRTRFEGDLPRLGSGNLSQRRAARLCQVGFQPALCL